jgi:hypothetical protein
MVDTRGVFTKIVAIALNPGAYEDEAIAALLKARELAKKDPSLAHPPATPPQASPTDDAVEIKISNVSPYWVNILLNSLSREAYGLGLKSKFVTDFGDPHVINIRCDGPKSACDAFRAHVDWSINYVNSQPKQQQK